ncbi:MAG: vitamin B12-dependent ribonucleotide reductase [Phycisphaerae bacterium]|nr:vitamin B12-dependent ribonucleotide reductase [Phycisphaerae bacterium]
MVAFVKDRHGENGTDPKSEPDLGLPDNALRVLRARYLKKDESGQVVESPNDLFRRVARTIADVEIRYGADASHRDIWETVFFDMMVDWQFLPNSPTLMNAGREMGMLSACFVLPVRDSINEIFDAIKQTALIQKAGGGTGFAFDELRPTGDYIKSSGGTTSGPISFWRAFSEATNAIQQGAFRRGANMGMMNIHHPDILKFLNAKQDLTQFTNYNISVKITDQWMEEFLDDEDSPHIVRNPRTGQEFVMPRDLKVWEYDVRSLIPIRRGPNGELRVVNRSDETEEVITRGSAFSKPVYTKRDVWRIIVENAHRTGEPGVVFIDRINEYNPTPHLGRIEATNPCGEQPLLPYEACNLGSINLAKFVSESEGHGRVDWDALRSTVHHATRFLDNVIDANNYPLPEIEAMCKGNRKIGLGVMGFADALYKLGVAYNSDEGVAWGERFMKFINDESHNYSEQLAMERGCFPNWSGSVWDTRHHRPMRNAAVTTVAPTGTISIMADCSGGIEPMFSLAFFRNVLKGQEQGAKPMIQVNPIFERSARKRGFLSEGLMDRIARDGTLAEIDEIPEEIKQVFVCAHDISPEWHVRMQAAFQRHCDSSISKTINFPHDATTDEVDAIYRRAYELRCKGITVYRDGCREAQPMALKDKEQSANPSGPNASASTRSAPAEFKELEPREIPEIISGLRLRQMTPFGNMHVKITVDPKTERELEVFAQLGKGGDIATSDLEAICRMTSLWLRSGGSLRHVIRQLKDIGSSLQVPTREGKIMSLGDGLARAMQKYMRAKERFGLRSLLLGEYDPAELDRPASALPGKTNGNGNGKSKGHELVSEVRHATTAHAASVFGSPTLAGSVGASRMDRDRLAFKVKCPECGEGLLFSEGCNKCPSCGWAQC